MAKSETRIVVEQNGLLKSLCTFAQDSSRDKTVRISFPSPENFRDNGGFDKQRKFEKLKVHKFSMHPGNETNPSSFIVKHTMDYGNRKIRDGQLRIKKGYEGWFAIPIFWGLAGDLKQYSANENHKLIKLPDYQTGCDILLYSVLVTSSKFLILGTSDIGSHCVDFECFRVYIIYTFMGGISPLNTFLTTIYTRSPDSGMENRSDDFNPSTIDAMDYADITEKFTFHFRQLIESMPSTSGCVIPNLSSTFWTSMPLNTLNFAQDTQSIELFKLLQSRKLTLDPLTGGSIFKL